MGQLWLFVVEYVALFFLVVKMIRNCITVKTIHGYRIARLERIFFSYIYSMEFVTDTLFFCSIMFMITRPYSIIPAYTTYVISLIVIILTPKLD